MTNAVIDCILSRSAAKYYDPAATLSDDQIRELVRIGTTAPTSFHLQNWRFIAVRTPEAKARLRPIAWDQPAVTEAAVTFIVCGQFVPMAVAAVYSATKAAIHSYALSQRFLLKDTKVRVLEIAPPWARTDLMNSREAKDAMSLDQFIAGTLRHWQ